MQVDSEIKGTEPFPNLGKVKTIDMPLDLWTATTFGIVTPWQMNTYGPQMSSALRKTATWIMAQLKDYERNAYGLPLPEYSMISALLNVYMDESFEGDSYEWNVGKFDAQTKANLIMWLKSMGVKPFISSYLDPPRDELEPYWNHLENDGANGWFGVLTDRQRQELWSFISGANLLQQFTVDGKTSYVLSRPQLISLGQSHGIPCESFDAMMDLLIVADRGFKSSVVKVARLARNLYQHRMTIDEEKKRAFEENPENKDVMTHYNQYVKCIPPLYSEEYDNQYGLLPEDDCLWRLVSKDDMYEDARAPWYVDSGILLEW